MNPVWQFLDGVPKITAPVTFGVLTISTSDATSTGPYLAPDGSATAPFLARSGDSDTGFWSAASGFLNFTTNGATRIRIGGVLTLGSAGGFAWSDNADPTAGTADITLSRLAAGSWASVGPNGSATNIRKATTALTTDSGAAPATATNLIPAGSLVIGVDARVTTILAGTGLTTWSLGDGSDADRWATGKALAAGTTVTLADATINAPPIYAAATSVVLTAAAGQFDSGVVRLTVHYLSLTAATS